MTGNCGMSEFYPASNSGTAPPTGGGPERGHCLCVSDELSGLARGAGS